MNQDKSNKQKRKVLLCARREAEQTSLKFQDSPQEPKTLDLEI